MTMQANVPRGCQADLGLYFLSSQKGRKQPRKQMMKKSSAAYLMFQTLWDCRVILNLQNFAIVREPVVNMWKWNGTWWNREVWLYYRWCYLLCVCVPVNVNLRGCISSSKLMHEDGSDLPLVNMSVMVDIHPCSYYHSTDVFADHVIGEEGDD